MGKRSAVVELFLGDMGSIQRELRPTIQREDQLTMETKLEQIAVKAVNQLPKSVVREIRTPRSVGTGGGRPPPVTRWARRNPRPYRDHVPQWGPGFCRCALHVPDAAFGLGFRYRSREGSPVPPERIERKLAAILAADPKRARRPLAEPRTSHFQRRAEPTTIRFPEHR